MSINDPLSIVDNLNPEVIRDELVKLANQQAALRVLLRSAVARQRFKGRSALATAVRNATGGKGGGANEYA
jgi:hypothetical protein